MTNKTVACVCAVVCLSVFASFFPGQCRAEDRGARESSAARMTEGEFKAMAESLGKAYGAPLVVPAAAFRSDGINPDQLRYQGNLGILQGQDAENAYAVAPIYLPEGVTVTSVQASIFDGFLEGGACDGVGKEDAAAWIFRVVNSTGETQQMAFFTTSGSSASIQHLMETSIDYPVTAYPEYAYYAVVRLCHSAQAFHALQVFYTE